MNELFFCYYHFVFYLEIVSMKFLMNSNSRKYRIFSYIEHVELGMHRARAQIGNPGLDASGLDHSRGRPFPVPGIPEIVIHIVAVELINHGE
jgi:hypothetical protein